MNIVLAVMNFGRGVCIYYLLRRLFPKNPALALVGGALAIVYMGDSAFYSLVVVSITTALVSFLIALIALLDYWQRPRWYIVILMWATLAFSIGIYEVSYPLIVAAPLILLVMNKRIDWRLTKVAFLWYIVPAIYIAINLLARVTTSAVGSYQTSLLNPRLTLSDVVRSFTEVYVQAFGRSWQQAENSIPKGLSDGRLLLAVIVALFIGIVLFLHKSSDDTPLSYKKGAILIAGSLIAMTLGHAPYLITVLSLSSFRTYFYVLPFASIALATLVFMLTQLKPIPRIVISIVFLLIAITYFSRSEWLAAFLVLMIAIGFLMRYEWRYVIVGAGLIGFAGAAMIGLHYPQFYAALPAYQQRLATTIAKQAPAIKSNSLILWTGTPGTARQYTIIRNRSDVFQAMMQFVYKQYNIEAKMCNPDGSVTGDIGERCTFEHDAVVISSPDGVKRWLYNRVIAFTYEPATGAVLLNKIPPEWMSEPGGDSYNPEALIDHDAPLPFRLGTVWTNMDYGVTDKTLSETLPDW